MPYYANRLIESAADTFTDADWLEVIGTDQPGGGEGFTLENGSATILVQIPWRKARSFLRYALGWSYVQQGPPYLLTRENPLTHPRFPWLTVSSVAFNGSVPVGVPGVGTKTDGVFVDQQYIARYDHEIATVTFSDRPWLFLEDDDAQTPVQESQRNTYWDAAPSVEVISAEGINGITFANGPSGGRAVPAPFGTLMSKINYTLNWMWVPQEYISGADTAVFFPERILNCVGRCNSLPFQSFPAGTLLLQAPVFTRFRFPIATAGGVYGYFGWNIRLPMQYFDPDRGTDDTTLMTRTDDTSGVFQVTVSGSNGSYYSIGDVVLIYFFGGTTTAVVTGATFSTVGTNTTTTVTFGSGTGSVLPTMGTAINVINDSYRGNQLIPYRPTLKWYGGRRSDGSKLFPEADFNQIFANINGP